MQSNTFYVNQQNNFIVGSPSQLEQLSKQMNMQPKSYTIVNNKPPSDTDSFPSDIDINELLSMADQTLLQFANSKPTDPNTQGAHSLSQPALQKMPTAGSLLHSQQQQLPQQTQYKTSGFRTPAAASDKTFVRSHQSEAISNLNSSPSTLNPPSTSTDTSHNAVAQPLQQLQTHVPQASATAPPPNSFPVNVADLDVSESTKEALRRAERFEGAFKRKARSSSPEIDVVDVKRPNLAAESGDVADQLRREAAAASSSAAGSLRSGLRFQGDDFRRRFGRPRDAVDDEILNPAVGAKKWSDWNSVEKLRMRESRMELMLKQIGWRDRVCSNEIKKKLKAVTRRIAKLEEDVNKENRKLGARGPYHKYHVLFV